jgi:hypothetical protein
LRFCFVFSASFAARVFFRTELFSLSELLTPFMSVWFCEERLFVYGLLAKNLWLVIPRLNVFLCSRMPSSVLGMLMPLLERRRPFIVFDIVLLYLAGDIPLLYLAGDLPAL